MGRPYCKYVEHKTAPLVMVGQSPPPPKARSIVVGVSMSKAVLNAAAMTLAYYMMHAIP